jgi:copper resistance protein C
VKERNRIVVSVLILVAVIAIAVARVASAHGNLESANPEPDSTVPVSPERVSVRFSEEIDPDGSSMTVRGPDGEVVDMGDGAPDLNDPDRRLMTVTLQPNLTPGTYTVEWVTVSAEDADTEEGTFSFTFDPDAPAIETPALVAPVGTPSPLPLTAAEDDPALGRGALILGVVAILVAVIVVATVGRRRSWR